MERNVAFNFNARLKKGSARIGLQASGGDIYELFGTVLALRTGDSVPRLFGMLIFLISIELMPTAHRFSNVPASTVESLPMAVSQFRNCEDALLRMVEYNQSVVIQCIYAIYTSLPKGEC